MAQGATSKIRFETRMVPTTTELCRFVAIRYGAVWTTSKKPSLVKAVLLATSFLTTTQRNTDRVYQAESKCAGWKTDATTDRQG